MNYRSPNAESGAVLPPMFLIEPSTAQFQNWLAAFDDEAWAATIVEVGDVARDTHVLEDCCGQVAGCHRAFLDLTGIAFRCTDDLTVSQASPSNRHRHYDRPMVAAVGTPLSADLRRSTELAHRKDEYVLEQSAFAQIADQCCDQMIEHGQQRPQSVPDAAIGWNVVAMCVPGSGRAMLTQVNRDEADPGFNQSPREQYLFRPFMGAVLRFHRSGLLRDIECLPGSGAGDQVNRLASEAVGGVHRSRQIEVSTQSIEIHCEHAT